MRFVLLFILKVAGADPVTFQVATSTQNACETARAKLLSETKEAGLRPVFATCLDTGRTG